ncbi:hypothetical protein GCM10017752_63550 [Streptomyces roseoviridis]
MVPARPAADRDQEKAGAPWRGPRADLPGPRALPLPEQAPARRVPARRSNGTPVPAPRPPGRPGSAPMASSEQKIGAEAGE